MDTAPRAQERHELCRMDPILCMVANYGLDLGVARESHVPTRREHEPQAPA
jgi:hypothetical protein